MSSACQRVEFRANEVYVFRMRPKAEEIPRIYPSVGEKG